jgi:hypothetical protein
VSYAKGDFRGIGKQKIIVISNFPLLFCPQNSDFHLSLIKGSALPEEFIVLG